MTWNWQLPGWPKFSYNLDRIAEQEKQFLLKVGTSFASIKKMGTEEQKQYIVEILSKEGQESSKIEGEILDRESLQSSLKRHFGLACTTKGKRFKEEGMAEVLCDVYDTFQKPLTHEMLWGWHERLFKSKADFDLGAYRSHDEPMQIVSHRMDVSRVFFEAPPSKQIPREMDQFIEWFNSSTNYHPILGRAAIAHVYFESIHPFEDGNGRIGRLLIEKSLSQGIGESALIAVSHILEKKRKDYYAALESCNRTLDISHWVDFFAKSVLEAQQESLQLLHFIVEKSAMMSKLSGQINERQEKALLRLFAEGPQGFKGGLSAENYIAITKTSRATATRDLAELVAWGVLIKTGELRHTRYRLNIPLE